MKVTVKPGLIVFYNPKDWEPIQYRLGLDHGTRVLISYVCKRELGFTIRRHKGLVPHPQDTWEVMKSEGWNHRYHYQDQIHLDFYNEAQQTWFVLKYLNNCAVDQ
jgi:hypothetical protein